MNDSKVIIIVENVWGYMDDDQVVVGFVDTEDDAKKYIYDHWNDLLDGIRIPYFNDVNMLLPNEAGILYDDDDDFCFRVRYVVSSKLNN